MTPATRATAEQVAIWAEANPYRVYGERGEELTPKQAGFLLSGDWESFDSEMMEWESHCHAAATWESWELDCAREFGFDDFESMPEELQEAAIGSRFLDMTDAIETAIRHTLVHVVAIPLDDAGEPYEVPNSHDTDREENARRIRLIRRDLGIRNPWKFESTYGCEVVKVCGTVDLLEIYRSYGKKLATITLRPEDSDNVLSHTLFNGSGGLGSVKLTRRVTRPAKFRNDAADRNGVDAVYGFTRSYWSHELGAGLTSES